MDTDLIYGIDDRPPLKETLFAAIQHLLAIFVAIITPPLIIAGALKLDLETTGFLVSMALFASGVSTFVQCRKLGPVGAGLLCIQGTSFSFIGPIITAGLAGGLPLIFGVCIAASPVEMIVSRTFKYLRSVITPLVSGIVVLLIGLSLIKVGVVACGGGYTAMDNGTFGSLRNIGVAVCVLLSVLFFNRCKNKYLRMSSIVLGLCIGYAIAFAMGMVDMEAVSSQNLRGFNIPVPFKYGLDFNISSFVAIALIYLITAIEATGDITANSMISGKSIEGEGYLKRVSGGVLAVVFGVYQPFMEALTHPKTAIPKYWRWAIPLGLGWAVGFLGLAKGIAAAMVWSQAATTWLFIGLILGTMPALFQEAGKEGRPRSAGVSFAVAFAVMFLGLFYFSHVAGVKVTPNFWWYSFCGVLWGLGVVVPGMTAASVMMALGLYEPMMASLAAMDLPVLLSTLPGMGLTILAFARLMGWVFREHYPVAAHGILGVVLASTLVILPTAYQGGWEMALSAACCAAGFLLAYGLAQLDRKIHTEE